MNSYELSRAWFDWCFDNPEKISPGHTALYFFAIEHCNRLGWKEKFGFPSQMAMEALGIKNWRTYSKILNDLIEFGFINLIEKSKNQYSSNIIAIVKNTKACAKAQYKALDKALQKHSTKQRQSIVSIDKQETNNLKQETNNNNEDSKKSSLHSILKQTFIDFYYEKNKIDYYWSAKEATNLNSLIKKLKFSIEKKEDVAPTNDQVLNGFKYILKNINDKWVLKNLSIAIINSKYNEIISQLTSGNNKNANIDEVIRIIQERENSNL